MKKIYSLLQKIYWLIGVQFGVDPIKFYNSFRGVPRYIWGLHDFRSTYTGCLELKPCLYDWYEEGGAVKNEYFWQDLLVARMIYQANPIKHVDIGSRIDGFVSHVASFREIEIFDIRPISISIPGILFKQADLMANDMSLENYCDSLSCLHALEHFGLGRYGDSIDPKGYELGISNMARILKLGGIFYLSIPIGIERVEFNANRVFDPNTIIKIAHRNKLELSRLATYSSDSGWSNIEITESILRELGQKRYSLGVFIFVKTKD